MHSDFEVPAPSPAVAQQAQAQQGRAAALWQAFLGLRQAGAGYAPVRLNDGDDEAGEAIAYDAHRSSRKKCCACRQTSVIGALIVTGVLLGLVIVVLGLSWGNYWDYARKTGDQLLSTVTRYGAMQQRHTVRLLTDTYGDAVDVAMAVTEVSAAAPRPLGLLDGWVDVHARRIDWSLRVIDPGSNVTGAAIVKLWAQQYNTTVRRLQHLPGSPLELCKNATHLPCTGMRDDSNLTTLALDDARTVLAVAVHASEQQRAEDVMWVSVIS